MRARVYKDAKGFQVRWQAVRRYRTREEADAAARLPLPPPVRRANQPMASKALRALIRQCLDAGIKPRIVAAFLNEAGVPPVRAERWTGSLVRGIANFTPAPRDAPALVLVLQYEQPPELWSTAQEEDAPRLRDWLRAEPQRARLLDDALALLPHAEQTEAD